MLGNVPRLGKSHRKKQPGEDNGGISSVEPSQRARRVIWGGGLTALDVIRQRRMSYGAWAGGTCGNVLAILADLGWTSHIIGCHDAGAAARRVRGDLMRCGVDCRHLSLPPAASAPICVIDLTHGKYGPKHRFRHHCPVCNEPLPWHVDVEAQALDGMAGNVAQGQVFFFDRPSHALVNLAERARGAGAIVFFEPSDARRFVPDDVFERAVQASHIVKYANDRIDGRGPIVERSESLLLEIRTMGAKGLQWRHRPGGRRVAWQHIPPCPVARVIDACGCGDWLSATLIAYLCAEGSERLLATSSETVQDALVSAMRISAWNCGFVGPRGGIYANDMPHRTPFKTNYPAVFCPNCQLDNSKTLLR